MAPAATAAAPTPAVTEDTAPTKERPRTVAGLLEEGEREPALPRMRDWPLPLRPPPPPAETAPAVNRNGHPAAAGWRQRRPWLIVGALVVVGLVIRCVQMISQGRR